MVLQKLTTPTSSLIPMELPSRPYFTGIYTPLFAFKQDENVFACSTNWGNTYAKLWFEKEVEISWQM
jgi:hypothetical protein